MLKTILATALLASSALAMTASGASAHGCHRHPEEGRYGWHRHVGPDCERVPVSRPGYRERSEYRYRDDRRDRRPRCEEKCKYIGPFKQCKTVCH